MARQIGIVILGVALIALLAAIIFPVFAQAKQAARGSKRNIAHDPIWRGSTSADEAPLHTIARQPGADRAVARQATLGVDVANLESAETEMKKAVVAGGGYVDRADGVDLTGEKPRMLVTIRVPERSFEQVISALEALGKRFEKRISSGDLTEQILSMEARLQQLKRNQGKQAVDGIPDNSITDRIKYMQHQKDVLIGQAAMSTIELRLQQKANADLASAASAGWGSDTWNAAVSSATGTFRFFGAIGIWLLVYSPVWGVVLLASLIGYRGWKKATGKPQTA
jgi:hypothetical protein